MDSPCVRNLSRYVADELQIIARSMIEIAQDKLGFRMDTNYYAQIFISYSIFIQRIKKDMKLQKHLPDRLSRSCMC